MRTSITTTAILVLATAGCQTVQLDSPVRPRAGDWTLTGASPAHNTRTAVGIRPPLIEAWQYNAGAAFGPGGVVVIRDAVLVGTRKGELHAVELDSGKRIGTVNFDEPIEGTPVLDAPVLYVATAWGEETLRAYDLERGRTLWSVESEPVDAAMQLLDGVLVVAATNGTVHGRDPADGRLLWSIETPGASVSSSPVSADGRTLVVADQGGGVRAIAAADGRVRWRADVDAPVYADLVAVDGRVVVSTTRGRVVALDAETGRSAWQYTVVDRTVRFAPAAGDRQQIVFGATDGIVRSVDARDGSLRWMAPLDDGVTTQPLLAGATVWVATLGSVLVALDAATGSVDWTRELEGRSRSALTVHGNGIIVLSEPRTVTYLVPEETRETS